MNLYLARRLGVLHPPFKKDLAEVVSATQQHTCLVRGHNRITGGLVVRGRMIIAPIMERDTATIIYPTKVNSGASVMEEFDDFGWYYAQAGYTVEDLEIAKKLVSSQFLFFLYKGNLEVLEIERLCGYHSRCSIPHYGVPVFTRTGQFAGSIQQKENDRFYIRRKIPLP